MRALARELGCAVDPLLDAWNERAAIREYDGGQPRAAAEHDALEDLRRELAITGIVSGPRRDAVRIGAASSIESSGSAGARSDAKRRGE